MHQMYLRVKIDGATQAENEAAGVAAMAVFGKEGISAWNAAGGVSAGDRYQLTASGKVTGVSDEDWRAAEVWDNAQMAAIESFRACRGLSEADDQARRYDMCIAGPYDDLLEELRKLSWKLPDAWKVMGTRYVYAFLVQLSETTISHGLQKIDARLARWLLLCQDRCEGPGQV